MPGLVALRASFFEASGQEGLALSTGRLSFSVRSSRRVFSQTGILAEAFASASLASGSGTQGSIDVARDPARLRAGLRAEEEEGPPGEQQ